MVPGKPLTKRQRVRVARAVSDAEDWTGLQFCVYLGPTWDDPRAHAEAMLAEHGLAAAPAALLLVAPEARRFEIVTSPAAARRLSDHAIRLAALAMTASFSVGDIAGGITEAVRQLAQAAGEGPAGEGPAAGAELPDVLG